MIRFRLRELMADKGFNEDRKITFEEVSRETGIHRTTLTKVANQKGYNASTDIIDKLCSYFQVPVQKIIEHVPDREG
ncbi:helix-turn-helix domain-containing protein [Kordiimonas sp.]|nr:helix-turn-helix transcriptional regulator [Kordiimonas lipolytica]